MTKVIKTISVVLGLFVAVSCQSTGKQSQTSETKTTQSNEASSETLKAVFNAYFGLKDAFVASNDEAVKAQAEVLTSAIKGVKMKDLGQEEHKVFMQVMKPLISSSEAIAEATSLSEARASFSEVSEELYKLAVNSKLSQKIYHQHCPMALEGQGANWLSKEEAIKNPYFGDAMLSCGQTLDTIK